MARKEKKGLGGVLSRSGVPLSGVAPGVALAVLAALLETVRSEERRVGKECRL